LFKHFSLLLLHTFWSRQRGNIIFTRERERIKKKDKIKIFYCEWYKSANKLPWPITKVEEEEFVGDGDDGDEEDDDESEDEH